MYMSFKNYFMHVKNYVTVKNNIGWTRHDRRPQPSLKYGGRAAASIFFLPETALHVACTQDPTLSPSLSLSSRLYIILKDDHRRGRPSGRPAA